MRKLSWILLLAIAFSSFKLSAKEGMWIPMLVEQLNYEDLKANGFKLSAKDIYSINNASLKDAIVIFGRGCTGEVVSDKGLIFTNHHCGYGQIQRHSSEENNYLREGFWAMSQEEELPNKGLTVKFLVKMIEFTEPVMNDIDKSLPFHEQRPHIMKRIDELETAVEDTSKYLASVEKFFGGNQYYLFLYNEYTDVRLVGAPPESIGNFGGDPDNWVWPRHTGDFSVFRIYADENGNPADYSEDNEPLKPKKYLPINAKGVSPGDFTMVLGYPGSTYEYLYSRELEYLKNSLYPARIDVRTGRLEIINKARSKNEKIYIQYATKQKRISNAWKKWKGVLYGFDRFNVIEKRKEYEKWLVENSGDKKSELEELYEVYEDTYIGYEPYWYVQSMFYETMMQVEPLSLRRSVERAKNSDKPDALEGVARFSENYFKDYNQDVDKALTKFLYWEYLNSIGEEFHPATIADLNSQEAVNEYVEKAYEKSVFTDKVRFDEAMEQAKAGKYKVFTKDPFWNIFDELVDISKQVNENYSYYKSQLESLEQEYILLLQAIDNEKPMYPDANFTMRMTYGKVEGYSPSDAVVYHYQTYLSGIMQKEAIGHEDYVVADKLKELYKNKDYGKYATEEGKMPVCFLASNHTSGGNSGSPVINAEGHLIGINFDRTWEGTMSDFNFDEEICRNISVDARYVLFVIDKFAGAGYLLDEMDIIWE